jgi:hypothetical protein
LAQSKKALQALQVAPAMSAASGSRGGLGGLPRAPAPVSAGCGENEPGNAKASWQKRQLFQCRVAEERSTASQTEVNGLFDHLVGAGEERRRQG